MFWDFPKECEYLIDCVHESCDDRLARGACGIGTGGYLVIRQLLDEFLVGWWLIPTIAQAVLLELQVQSRGQEHAREIVLDPPRIGANNRSSLHCVLEKPEDELNLPAICIQQYDLKCGEFRMICDDFIGRRANRKFDQTKC